MTSIWSKLFNATYVKEDGLVVLNDATIPIPDGFINDSSQRSTVIFPPNSRGGDHVHTIRHELFVGFGSGLTLFIEDPSTKERQRLQMDPPNAKNQHIVFWLQPGIPHAVQNLGNTIACLIELASHPQESNPYKLG